MVKEIVEDFHRCKMSRIKIILEFNESVYKIMKQRKNNYIKKNKLKELDWEEYFKIKILTN